MTLPPHLPVLHTLTEVQARLAAARQELADERAEEAAVQRIAARLYRRAPGAEELAPEQLVTQAALRKGGLTLALRRERVAALVDVVAGYEQLEILATIRDLVEKASEAADNGDFVGAQRFSAQSAQLRQNHRDLIARAEQEGIALP